MKIKKLTFDDGLAFMMMAVGEKKSLSKYWFVNQKVLVIEFQLFHICGSDIKAHMACDSNEMISCACDTEKPVWWLNKREGIFL